MKRTLLLPLFIFIFFNALGQKQVYEAPNFKKAIQQQKVVAILPLKVTISYKKFPKNFNAADNEAQEKEEGTNMQQGMYTYLLRKADDYFVSFQDVQRTNILLKQAGVYEKTDAITP